MAEIVLDHVSKKYASGAVAVRDVDITIADGEFVVLVGPSGCGKSTTLAMIAGLEPISSGELRIGGKRVNEVAPKDRDIAMVFQSYALYPHMSVRQNIAFPLTLRKVPKAEVAAKVDEVAQILDLVALLDRKPGQLSGGQRQRVAMGRAIVRQPKAFLMDEPLSNLDAKLRVQMRAEILRLRRRLQTTTVYVTHDQTEAMTLGDRVVVMQGGVVQQIAAPQALYDQPKNRFVAEFIGSPSMNFLPGQLCPQGVRTVFGLAPLPAGALAKATAAAKGPDVLLGLRPEHFIEDQRPFEDQRRADDAPGPGPAGSVPVEAEVDLVESVGSHRYVFFSSNNQQFVARVPAHSTAQAGERHPLRFDPAKAVVFDSVSGEAISY
jgi:multiple sugar transport system ATP-binding protein